MSSYNNFTCINQTKITITILRIDINTQKNHAKKQNKTQQFLVSVIALNVGLYLCVFGCSFRSIYVAAVERAFLLLEP